MTQTVKTQSLRRSSTVVAFGTLLSRVTGLVRDVVLAGVFGASGLTDAFFAAFRIPNTLRRLLAEGGVTVAVQPVYADILENKPERRREFEAAFFTIFRIVLLVFTVVGVIAAPLLLDMFAAGLRQTPGLRDEAIYLLRIMFPFVYFIGLIGAAMGILHSRGHFFAPAVGPVLLNLALIGGALTAAWRAIDGGLDATPLAASVVFGVILFWWLQRVMLRRYDVKQTWSWRPRDRDVRDVGRLLLPAVAGLSVYQLQVIVGTQFASFLAVGGFTCLWYADRLIQFPLALIGTAIGTVALPLLSRKRAAGESINTALAEALSFALFLVIPAAAGVYAVQHELVSTFFGWGAFAQDQITRTASAVGGYALALVPAAANRVLIPVFYADKQMKTPIIAGAFALVVQAGLSFWLLDWDVYGLALATAGASSMQFVVLLIFLARSGHRPDPLTRPMVTTLIAAAAMVAALVLADAQLTAWLTVRGMALAAKIVLGVFVYGGICLTLRHPELDKLRAWLGRSFRFRI